MGYIVKKVSNPRDAEEIMHDAYLGFLDSIPLFQGKSKLYTFLVSITRHEIADYYRKRHAKKAINYVPFIDTGYTQDLFTAKETREQFNKALQQLLPEERKLILWKYDRELSVKEIATKLDISVKSAESRLFRARKAFQVIYSEIEQV